jgi:glycosyltransferase involved in cell wall biosynthesis
MPDNNILPKAVVVHSGKRDEYQVALALQEGDFLDTLITDFYWNPTIYSLIKRVFPQKEIPKRLCEPLDYRAVRSIITPTIAEGLRKLVRIRRLNDVKNKALGDAAYGQAIRNNAAVLSYSYYGQFVFSTSKPVQLPYRFLFQLHPHHRAVKKILTEELERTPIARASLTTESELRLPSDKFEQLANEPGLANGWISASSYTARTLSEYGIPRDRIHVVPYGVDITNFARRERPPEKSSTFTVIFLGSLCQRKGLSYLLDAIRLLKTSKIRVLLRGRNIVDSGLLAHYNDVEFDVQIGLTTSEIVRELQSADLFVLPSLTEGFAQVILEAMACGLPVLTTNNTCAEDVLQQDLHGFIVPIRDPDLIAEKISWGIENREQLAYMGELASIHAAQFTWQRFRYGVREAYRSMLSAQQQAIQCTELAA